MADKSHLHVLWTTDNPVTAEKKVLMYTVNALAHGWREKVTLIVWGAAVTPVCLPDDCIGTAVMVVSRGFSPSGRLGGDRALLFSPHESDRLLRRCGP